MYILIRVQIYYYVWQVSFIDLVSYLIHKYAPYVCITHKHVTRTTHRWVYICVCTCVCVHGMCVGVRVCSLIFVSKYLDKYVLWYLWTNIICLVRITCDISHSWVYTLLIHDYTPYISMIKPHKDTYICVCTRVCVRDMYVCVCVKYARVYGMYVCVSNICICVWVTCMYVCVTCMYVCVAKYVSLSAFMHLSRCRVRGPTHL